MKTADDKQSEDHTYIQVKTCGTRCLGNLLWLNQVFGCCAIGVVRVVHTVTRPTNVQKELDGCFIYSISESMQIFMEVCTTN